MNRRLPSWLSRLLLPALLASGTALASPADDLIRGTHLRLTAASVRFDDNTYSVTHHLLPKSAGTLDMNLPARSFGFDSDLVVHLRGTRSGDTITWTFDDSLPAPYDLGGSYSLRRVYGQIVANVTLLHGSEDPACSGVSCPHNVRLQLASGTWLRVAGSGPFWDPSFDEAVQPVSFTALGGLPRARLADLNLRAPGRYCPSDRPLYLAGEVTLSGPAPTGGAWVNLTSSYPPGVSVWGIRVAQGQRTARFDARVAAGFEGSVRVNAASGGAVDSVWLDLQQSGHCFYTPQWLWAQPLLCPKCSSVRGINIRGDLLAQVGTSDAIISAKGEVLDLAARLQAERVEASHLNAFGQVVGTAWRNGYPQAFLLDTVSKEAKPVYFKEATPAGLNDLGTVVGHVRVDGQQSRSFLYDGTRLLTQDKESLWSSAVAVNNRGEVAGTRDDGKGRRAFRSFLEQVEDLGELGGWESEARAINAAGVVVGTARNANGLWECFLAAPKDGMKGLGTLKGLPFCEARAINSAGHVVGTARDEKQGYSRGFLYVPGGELVDLNQLVPPEQKLEVLEALSINDDGQVLVRARSPEAEGFYLLAP